MKQEMYLSMTERQHKAWFIIPLSLSLCLIHWSWRTTESDEGFLWESTASDPNWQPGIIQTRCFGVNKQSPLYILNGKIGIWNQFESITFWGYRINVFMKKHTYPLSCLCTHDIVVETGYLCCQWLCRSNNNYAVPYKCVCVSPPATPDTPYLGWILHYIVLYRCC